MLSGDSMKNTCRRWLKSWAPDSAPENCAANVEQMTKAFKVDLVINAICEI